MARTKQYMSSEEFRTPNLLFLPFSVAKDIAQSGSVPQGQPHLKTVPVTRPVTIIIGFRKHDDCVL